jgi:flagellar protein FlaJ
MAIFKREPKVIRVGNERIELQPKPGKITFRFPKINIKPKAQKQSMQPAAASQPFAESAAQKTTAVAAEESAQPKSRQAGKISKPSKWKNYVQGIASKHTSLEEALSEQGIKSTVFEFVQKMLIASLMVAVAVAVSMFILFLHIGFSFAIDIVISLALGVAVFQFGFRTFLNFPMQKRKSNAKQVERDLLFAARDMIISLRSGMPLFNAITSISTGYGEASKEFAKIVKRVQLGMPLEDAIDQTVAQTQSRTFRRIMLQASVSIKAGADVVTALQSVIDQVSQERIIELRSYGQKLNALAMFYMLFGVILPSMGIAVITILTTFISFFTVDVTVLGFVLVGIVFLQIVFLQLIRSSRPVFSM